MSATEARYEIGMKPGEQDQYGSLLQVGFCTLTSRATAAGQAPGVSGTLNLTYFRAPRTLISSAGKVFTGSGTAASGLTLARYGLYSVDPTTGSLLSLVASTASDTTILAVANTGYSKSWSTPINITRGQWYAFGFLLVGTTMPQTIFGTVGLNGFVVGNTPPRMAASITGLSDLPASAASGTFSANGGAVRFYTEIS